MSSIFQETSYFDASELEEEEEEYKQVFSDKDSILFAIDCRVSMVTPDSEGNIPLHNIFTSLKSTILNKIFARPFDQVGVVLYNTINKDSPNRQDHIYVLDELDIPDAPRIKGIERFIRDQATFQDKFGSSQEEVPLSDVFYTCSEIFSESAPNIANKRIFLITDQDNPNSDQPQYRTTTLQKVKDLFEMNIAIELFGLDRADHKFDVSLFYKEILSTENNERNQTSICNTENLNNLINLKQSKKKSDFSIPFKIAEDLTIGVKGYSLVLEKRIGSHIQLAATGQQVAEAKSIAIMRCVDTNQIMTQSDLKYSFDYGGEKVVFTKEEMKSLHNLKTNKPGLNIIGFKNISAILSYYQILHPYFIYPDETQYEGSTKVFFQLLNSMHKKGKAAICSLVRRANTDIKLVALLPQKEILDDQDFQLKPPGFNVIVLPFAEDIRNVPVDSTPIPGREEIEILNQMIENATIPEYNIGAHKNPAIEMHHNMIKAIALEQELEMPDDTLVPTPQFLKLSDKINEFKALVKLENLTIETTQTAYTAKRKAAETSAEIKKLKAENLSIEQLWQRGQLENVKNNDLKIWLNEHGVSPANVKKKMIEQISELLSSRAE